MNLGSESETVEFKKSTGEHKEALQAMSAMLNKHGRGELYFGVKDNGEVIGQDATDATIRQIAGWISDKVEPSISPTIDRLTDEDAKAYIRVAFSGMDAPYSADGRYFTRVGTSNKQMAASELTTMIIERDRARNPWDSLPSGRLIEDVDETAVREFVEMGKAAGRIGDGPADAAGVLKRLGMLASDGTLTNAGAVMFCHSPIQYPRMKLGLLAGNDKLDIFDLQQEGLPLIQLLKKAEFFVVSNIRRRFVFGEPGMQRREIPEIPREAVREAIANALCHRDYTTGTAVEVNVYMDFVEVVSPGLFPDGDSPENHLEGGDGGLKQRNPGIAQALFRSGMIEQYGTGIPRIKRYCDAEGVKFSYRQTANTTVIRFNRPGAQVIEALPSGAESTKKAPELEGAFDLAEATAMRIAQKNGKVTKRELMEEAGVGRTKATGTLKKLAEKGSLVWVGRNSRDPYQYYRLPDVD